MKNRMKQFFIFIAAFFISFDSAAQTELEKTIMEIVCKCMGTLTTFDEESFGKCFQKALEDKETLLTEAMTAQGLELTEEAGYEFGKKLVEKLSVEMVKDCAAYAALMNTLRNNSFAQFNRDSVKAELAASAKVPANLQDADFFINKGLAHFILEDYLLAIDSFNKALQKNDSALQAIFFKAWAKEKAKDYDEAIRLYSKVSQLSNNSQFAIFAELAKLKKEGRLAD